MLRTFVAALSLLTLGNANAQEGVMFCVESASTGFNPQGNNRYSAGSFGTDRFTMKLDESNPYVLTMTTVQDKIEGSFLCQKYVGRENQFACTNLAGQSFNYNKANGHFTRTYAAGFAFNTEESLVISYGTCSDF